MVDPRRRALRFVLLVGAMSFFSDFTYEGARGIAGPFLALLGASGAAVGIASGLGELVGYGLRLVSGRLADTTGPRNSSRRSSTSIRTGSRACSGSTSPPLGSSPRASPTSR